MGPSDETAVRLTRVLPAPPEKVFSAWTEPGALERWWTGVGGWVEAHAEIDLRVGGRYRLSMRDQRGVVHGIGGIYTDVERPERLSFTWTWEDEPSVMRGSEGSRVDVLVREGPGGTLLSLTHVGLKTELARELHEQGWNALLTSLFAEVSQAG